VSHRIGDVDINGGKYIQLWFDAQVRLLIARLGFVSFLLVICISVLSQLERTISQFYQYFCKIVIAKSKIIQFLEKYLKCIWNFKYIMKVFKYKYFSFQKAQIQILLKSI